MLFIYDMARARSCLSRTSETDPLSLINEFLNILPESES